MTLSVANFIDKLTGAFGGIEDSSRDLRKYVGNLFNKVAVLQVPTDADGDFTVASASMFRADRDITVVSVYLLTAGTITAHGTNYTTLALNKYDGAGGSATIVSSRATDTVTTDDVAAGVPWALVNSSTAADLNLAAGAILGVTGTKASAGVTVPAAVLIVNYKER